MNLNTPPHLIALKDTKPGSELSKLDMTECLGENISHHRRSGDVIELEVPLLHLLSGVVIGNIDVFGLGRDHWIVNQVESRTVIAIHLSCCLGFETKFLKDHS